MGACASRQAVVAERRARFGGSRTTTGRSTKRAALRHSSAKDPASTSCYTSASGANAGVTPCPGPLPDVGVVAAEPEALVEPSDRVRSARWKRGARCRPRAPWTRRFPRGGRRFPAWKENGGRHALFRFGVRSRTSRQADGQDPRAPRWKVERRPRRRGSRSAGPQTLATRVKRSTASTYSSTRS